MSDVWKPSVTVAAIAEREGRFLLVEEHTSEGVRINQPAGHLDPGESLIDAVVRETLEETACRFEPTALLGCYMSRYRSPRTQEDVTYLRFAFVGRVLAQDAGRALDKEIIRAFWATAEELEARAHEHRSPLVARCVQDYLSARRNGGTFLPLEAIYTHPSVLTK